PTTASQTPFSPFSIFALPGMSPTSRTSSALGATIRRVTCRSEPISGDATGGAPRGGPARLSCAWTAGTRHAATSEAIKRREKASVRFDMVFPPGMAPSWSVGKRCSTTVGLSDARVSLAALPCEGARSARETRASADGSRGSAHLLVRVDSHVQEVEAAEDVDRRVGCRGRRPGAVRRHLRELAPGIADRIEDLHGSQVSTGRRIDRRAAEDVELLAENGGARRSRGDEQVRALDPLVRGHVVDLERRSSADDEDLAADRGRRETRGVRRNRRALS